MEKWKKARQDKAFFSTAHCGEISAFPQAIFRLVPWYGYAQVVSPHSTGGVEKDMRYEIEDIRYCGSVFLSGTTNWNLVASPN